MMMTEQGFKSQQINNWIAVTRGNKLVIEGVNWCSCFQLMLFLLSLATPIYSWANESILNRGPFLESPEAFRVHSGDIILFKAKASQSVKLCNYFNMRFLNHI